MPTINAASSPSLKVIKKVPIIWLLLSTHPVSGDDNFPGYASIQGNFSIMTLTVPGRCRNSLSFLLRCGSEAHRKTAPKHHFSFFRMTLKSPILIG